MNSFTGLCSVENSVFLRCCYGGCRVGSDTGGQQGLHIRSDSEARKRAREYKSVLDAGKDGTNIYKDLIELRFSNSNRFAEGSVLLNRQHPIETTCWQVWLFRA